MNISPEKYQDMLSDEQFLNDLFVSLDATTKVSILREALDIEDRWDEYQEQFKEL